MCEPWFCVGLGWLPIMVGLMLATTMIIPYCIAIGLGHIEPGFPYISDTGTLPPESCVFGQLLNITAALAFGTIYVRYKQVEEFHTNNSTPNIRSINRICLVLGSLAAFGMSLVANFQESSMILIHMLGAFMCFGLGTVYGFANTYITHKMQPHHSTVFVCRMRFITSTLSLVFLIISLTFTFISQKMHSKQYPEGKPIYDWSPDDEGYAYHLVATTTEWCLGLCFLAYFFTFIREFQKLDLITEVKRSYRYQPIPGDNISALLT